MGRIYNRKKYFKYILVIPNNDIEKLKWESREALETEVKGGKLIIKKKK